MSVVLINQNKHDIDGILFDKDGTIIDFMLWIHWANLFIDIIDNQADFNVDKEALSQSLGYSYHKGSWDPKGPLAISSQQDIVTILSLSMYQQGVPWNQAYEIVKDSLSSLEKSFEMEDYVKPIDGLIPFLEAVKEHKIQLGVVTSDDYDSAKQHLDALGITGYFASIIGHDLVERGKPFPDMVYNACEQLGVTPEKTIIFGDSNGDMILGKKGGLLASIGIIPSVDAAREHLQDADYIINDYQSIEVKNV